MAVQHYFSDTYAEAREKFIASAQARGFELEHRCHPDHVGAQGEVLAIDSALYAPVGATSLLIFTSGTHGVEGFCGSGCQVGMLNDDALMASLHQNKVALLLIHAVNPYGFSHLRRVNEDNVDLNRNVVDFQAMADSNPDYIRVDPLVLPVNWPPTQADNAALAGFIEAHGQQVFRDAVTKGQYRVADGMFYGGASASWSTREVRAILSEHAVTYARLAWIDIHTGLGPYGHGEKILMSRDAAELERAVSFWGMDVKPVFEPGSISSDAQGPLLNLIYDTCPGTETTTLALEFGTLDALHVMQALRADHWLHRHPETPPDQAALIRQNLKAVFYCDTDDWKNQIYQQTRTLALQSIAGLAQTDETHKHEAKT